MHHDLFVCVMFVYLFVCGLFVFATACSVGGAEVQRVQFVQRDGSSLPPFSFSQGSGLFSFLVTLETALLPGRHLDPPLWGQHKSDSFLLPWPVNKINLSSPVNSNDAHQHNDSQPGHGRHIELDDLGSSLAGARQYNIRRRLERGCIFRILRASDTARKVIGAPDGEKPCRVFLSMDVLKRSGTYATCPTCGVCAAIPTYRLRSLIFPTYLLCCLIFQGILIGYKQSESDVLAISFAAFSCCGYTLCCDQMQFLHIGEMATCHLHLSRSCLEMDAAAQAQTALRVHQGVTMTKVKEEVLLSTVTLTPMSSASTAVKKASSHGRLLFEWHHSH